MTFTNFKTDEKVDKFIDMLTKLNMQGENEYTFSFKISTGISDA